MAVKCHSVRFNRRVLICGTLLSKFNTVDLELGAFGTRSGAKPPTAREGRHDWPIVEYQYK